MSDDLHAQFTAARRAGDETSMSELGRQLYPEPGVPISDSYAPIAGPAPKRDLDTEIAAVRAEQLTSRDPTRLNDKLEELYRLKYPEGGPDPDAAGPSPDTLTWAADTPPEVQRALSALAAELRVSRSETQAALTELSRATWQPAETFHATMRREWGTSYRDNLARAQRELEALPGHLRDAIADRMVDDVFSPEVARWLVRLPSLRARGRSGSKS
jgi:hypothetical protein